MKTLNLVPFIKSCEFIINEVTELAFTTDCSISKSSPFFVNERTVLFGILGDIKGQVSFSMNKELSRAITSSMLKKMGLEETEEFICSAISEFGNMIMGNASNEYYKKGVSFDITPPSILTGDNLSFSVEKVEIICIPIRFENGNILEVNIAYKFI